MGGISDDGAASDQEESSQPQGDHPTEIYTDNDRLGAYATYTSGHHPHNHPRFTLETPRCFSGSLQRGGFQQSTMSSAADYYPSPHKPYVAKHVDSTGCFHWVPDTPIERVKLVSRWLPCHTFDTR